MTPLPPTMAQDMQHVICESNFVTISAIQIQVKFKFKHNWNSSFSLNSKSSIIEMTRLQINETLAIWSRNAFMLRSSSALGWSTACMTTTYQSTDNILQELVYTNEKRDRTTRIGENLTHIWLIGATCGTSSLSMFTVSWRRSPLCVPLSPPSAEGPSAGESLLLTGLR